MKPHQWILLASWCHFSILISPSPVPTNQSAASALLDFKSKADPQNRLQFTFNTSFHSCEWKGIHCSNNSAVVKVVIENMNLGGIFAPDTVTELRELQVLSLSNNSLTGTIPDLSRLIHLKALFLSRNFFSGSVPASISTLRRLKTLDLSFNDLAGFIPPSLNNLTRLLFLRLDCNRLNGSIPPFNLSSLQIFNVSQNALVGPIPYTPTLSRFSSSGFAMNPGLCGEIINKQCPPTLSIASSSPPPSEKHETVIALVIGFSLLALFLIISALLFFCFKRRRKIRKMTVDNSILGYTEAVKRIEEENDELEEKVKRAQRRAEEKSGGLVFCGEDPPLFTMSRLMRACAELLGKGTTGTTYKAVLDNRSIVTVKRLDGERLGNICRDEFERYMGLVGELRHPNLVPITAYAQINHERLLIYEYQSNGSLFSLVHGGKPLHWTSCLKIAEDISQGLCYIHQLSKRVHGNLKSSNVLLGSDFEARLTDYCLVPALGGLPSADAHSTAYRAPEIVEFEQWRGTSESDVYSFGVLLLELVSVRNRSEMLAEVGMACTVRSPEHRPTMYQVLEMIQYIKEVMVMED